MIEIVLASIIIGITPPAKYDHPFDGRTVIIGDAARHCEPRQWGCTTFESEGNGLCIVHILPLGSRFGKQVLDKKGYAAVVRHEVAHCNGWWHP